MLNQNSNPFAQIRQFLEVGMFGEAINAYSKLRKDTTNAPELLSNKSFQREFKETEDNLDKMVRNQIQDIHRFIERGNTNSAFARCRQIQRILDVEPTSLYFSQYLYELNILLEQLENDMRSEQDFYEIQRLVDHHKLDEALYRIQILKGEVHPRAYIRREIETLHDKLKGITNVTLASTNSDSSDDVTQRQLTAEYLEKEISPFLRAMAEIQRLFDELLEREGKEITIKVISQNSPIGVSLEGVSDTFLAITDLLIPSKRKHAEKMAEYDRRERQYEIEHKRLELQEKNAQIEKIRIENEKARFELQREKERDSERERIQFAMEIIKKEAPEISEIDTMSTVVRLLPLLDVIIARNIEVIRRQAG